MSQSIPPVIAASAPVPQRPCESLFRSAVLRKRFTISSRARRFRGVFLCRGNPMHPINHRYFFPGDCLCRTVVGDRYAANQPGQIDGKTRAHYWLRSDRSAFGGGRSVRRSARKFPTPIGFRLRWKSHCASGPTGRSTSRKRPVAVDGEISREIGGFDVALEASGAPPALVDCVESVKPGSRIVQVGMLSNATVPLGRLIARELELVGTFRFCRRVARSSRAFGTRPDKGGYADHGAGAFSRSKRSI